jgi:hypothetical protein
MSLPTRQLIWQSLQSPLLLTCHVTAVILALVLILALSRYERRLVSRQLGLALLSLRLCVLAMTLFMLLQPAVVWTLEQTHSARILVGIDLSASMATMDRHASRGEKLRIARGLELIGNDASNERLNRWQLVLDTGQEPNWVEDDEAHDATHRQVLQESRQQQLEAIFREVDKLPRREIARKLVTARATPLIDQLGQAGRVELFAFAGKRESIPREQFEKIVADPPESLQTNHSDLSLGLQSMDGDELLGIILLTDGRDHSNHNLTAMAAQLKDANSPVYPVLVGSGFRPKDLAILLVEHPDSAYKGDHPQIKVTLGTSGFSGKVIDVELVCEDQPEFKPIRKSVVCQGSSIATLFELDAETVGRRNYIVRTPVLDGETSNDNNSRSFSLNIVDDRANVLIVEGEARWEFRYLESALSRDERVHLRTVLFDQPFLRELAEPFFPRELGVPADRGELAGSPFADCDMVIVGDVTSEQFTGAHCQSLLQYASKGGTLVIAAGPRSMPLAHHSANLEQLIPVTNLKAYSLADDSQDATPPLRGFPLSLTVEGEQLPMLQFAPDLAENVSIWNRLPGQGWVMLGEAKPNATVWATTQLPAGGDAGLATERSRGVMIHQFIGSGQVVWLGFDGTWRWRFRAGNKYHHRFWAQLARWAAANKLNAGADFVRFGPEKAEVEAGLPVSIAARWTQTFRQKFPNLAARAEFHQRTNNTSQPVATIELSAAQGQPLLYEGSISSLPVGDYQVHLVVDQADWGDKRIATSVSVVAKPNEELSDLTSNRPLLEEIAQASGGRLFQPDEMQDLPQFFRSGHGTTTQHGESSLWDRWPWMIGLFALMTAEWIIRKWNGLP